MYVVAAYIHKLRSHDNSWDYTGYDVPIFFLRDDVDEAQARKLVDEIVNPTKDPLIQVSAVSIRRVPYHCL